MEPQTYSPKLHVFGHWQLIWTELKKLPLGSEEKRDPDGPPRSFPALWFYGQLQPLFCIQWVQSYDCLLLIVQLFSQGSSSPELLPYSGKRISFRVVMRLFLPPNHQNTHKSLLLGRTKIPGSLFNLKSWGWGKGLFQTWRPSTTAKLQCFRMLFALASNFW